MEALHMAGCMTTKYLQPGCYPFNPTCSFMQSELYAIARPSVRLYLSETALSRRGGSVKNGYDHATFTTEYAL